jgi:hypothetical protein
MYADSLPTAFSLFPLLKLFHGHIHRTEVKLVAVVLVVSIGQLFGRNTVMTTAEDLTSILLFSHIFRRPAPAVSQKARGKNGSHPELLRQELLAL